MKVESGKFVKIDYVGTFDDGEEFDSSKQHGTPLGFVVGAGDMIKGFDDAVVGMSVGEEKSFHLTPENAYGEYKADMIKPVPKAQFPEGEGKLEAGIQIVLQTPDGYIIPATVKEIKDDIVMLDLNHPLAGKPLNFKINV
ncbi:MAG: peptidylprolyl isomerase, partial [Firmicutes bacterium HGW-Firmicutes-12]